MPISVISTLFAAAVAAEVFLSAKGAMAMTAHDFEFTSIEGEPMPLSDLKGQPLLVVNTASFCGFTPQYRGLEALWQDYKDKGLVLIGVPSDSFNQEHDDNAKIKEFCDTNYSITFPLTESNLVKGNDAHPFYKWVRDVGGVTAEPSWNFNKVLVGADGTFKQTFGSNVTPDSAALRNAIDATLPVPQ